MNTALSSSCPPEVHRWTRGQYDQMIKAGIIAAEERVELIDGYIVDMPPQSKAQAAALRRVKEVLRTAFGEEHEVRAQPPLALGNASKPRPDIAVVDESAPEDPQNAPAIALLVVEISGAAPAPASNVKKGLYAASGIQEYWVVNLDSARVTVYRQPGGTEYRSQRILQRDGSIRPLARPECSISVRELLPRKTS